MACAAFFLFAYEHYVGTICFTWAFKFNPLREFKGKHKVDFGAKFYCTNKIENKKIFIILIVVRVTHFTSFHTYNFRPFSPSRWKKATTATPTFKWMFSYIPSIHSKSKQKCIFVRVFHTSFYVLSRLFWYLPIQSSIHPSQASSLIWFSAITFNNKVESKISISALIHLVHFERGEQGNEKR